MTPIRALIVDDHPVTREGLRTLLELSGDDAVVVVGEAGSGEEAVERAVELTPDVVFMDVRMPGMSGHRGHAPDPPGDTRNEGHPHHDRRIARRHLRGHPGGVSGYLLKDASADALVDAARNAVEGNAVIHPQLTKTFIEEVQHADEAPTTTPLSKREREILQMVANGSTTKEVASDLGHLAAHREDPPRAHLREARRERPRPGGRDRHPHRHRRVDPGRTGSTAPATADTLARDACHRPPVRHRRRPRAGAVRAHLRTAPTCSWRSPPTPSAPWSSRRARSPT